MSLIHQDPKHIYNSYMISMSNNQILVTEICSPKYKYCNAVFVL